MYNTPIEIITNHMSQQIENEIIKTVNQCVINVNKEELLKALQYDRQQYEKGYRDGRESALKEIMDLASRI